ncbi:MAG: hypothetical protein BroJett006_26500 [Betaproteobacteria bacterium]|nr:MAG: hypothetical protein BroJett006_26500 [Betaproteobacteria bacterium]
MDDKLLATLIGIGSGFVGYFVTTFWMRPILRYLEIKEQVTSDLIFYSNVINADGLNDMMKKRMWARVEADRRHSADFTACYLNLPCWYRKWLIYRGESPEIASNHLMGLSNTFDHMAAADRVDKIKAALRLKTDVL